MLEAADTVVNGVPFACDVGVFNQDYFVYIAAFGLFTDVSYETKQSMKNVLGHLAYILEGTKRIFNIPSYRIKVTHDGETIEDEFIYGMVTNSRSVGGFKGITGNCRDCEKGSRRTGCFCRKSCKRKREDKYYAHGKAP